MLLVNGLDLGIKLCQTVGWVQGRLNGGITVPREGPRLTDYT